MAQAMMRRGARRRCAAMGPPVWSTGERAAACRLNGGGYDHGPSYCRDGMWLDSRRMLHVYAEPRFLPIRSADRGVADRIRAARRRCPDPRGAVLPYPL